MSKHKLGDIASIQAGPFGTQLHKNEYVLSGIPMLNSKNIGNGKIITDSIDYVPQAVLDRLPQYILKEGDILFDRAGTIEKHTYVDSKYNGWFQGTNCIRIRCFNKSYSLYISYYLWLNQLKQTIENKAGGSIQAYITTDLLKEISVYIPDNYVKIANVLLIIDKKIDVNNHINDNLQHQLKLLYDYWFTQFDFPDENGKPYRSSGGAMVWNEQLKRDIPEKRKVSPLGEMCSFKNGINYEKGEIGNKQYRIVNVRNITASQMLLDPNSFDTITLSDKKADKYLIGANDFLIARSGFPGATRLLIPSTIPTIYCGFIICCSTTCELRNYIALILKKLETANDTRSSGSILKNVNQDTLKEIMVCVPQSNILESFNSKANTIKK